MDKRERELRRTAAAEVARLGCRVESFERAGSGHVRIRISDGTRSHLIIAAWSPRGGRQVEDLRKNIRRQLGDTHR